MGLGEEEEGGKWGGGKREKAVLQMRNGDRSQPDRLHPAISIYQHISLNRQLTALRRIPPIALAALLDIHFHKHEKLQGDAQALVIIIHQAGRHHVVVFRILDLVAHGRGIVSRKGAPAGAEMVLGGEETGDEEFDHALRVFAVRLPRCALVGLGVVAAA